MSSRQQEEALFEAARQLANPAARRAFDIQAEPQRLRDEYGRNTLGQSCLMARRLVEAGVRCVTVDHSNWDTHDNNFATLRREHGSTDHSRALWMALNIALWCSTFIDGDPTVRTLTAAESVKA